MTTPLLERDPDEIKALRATGTPAEQRIIDLGLEAALSDWSVVGRAKQQPPDGDWLIWLLVTGRRWGKTRTAAEWLRKRALETVGQYAICAPTYGDARDVCVEGGDQNHPSGFRSVCKPGEIVNWNRINGELFMVNGSRIKVFGAEEEARARGRGLVAAWCDEFSSWNRPDTWHLGLLPAVSESDKHRFIITTTPKRNGLTREILEMAEQEPDKYRLVRGHTSENADNLGAGIVEELRERLSARMARQELDGELLDDVEGALWTMALIDAHTVTDFPDLERLVIAVDPAVTSGEHADDTGIAVCGRSNGTAYLLEDQTVHLDPHAAMAHVVRLYHDLSADSVIIEANNGQDYIPALLHTIDSTVKTEKVHATRGKRTRAEPIQGLTENGRVKFVGAWPELYDQLTTWVPGEPSPDRLDAFVWGMTALFPELANGEPRRLRFR